MYDNPKNKNEQTQNDYSGDRDKNNQGSAGGEASRDLGDEMDYSEDGTVR